MTQDGSDLEEGVKKVKLPGKYGSQEKTDLTKTVEGGNNVINLELKSK